MCGWSSQQCSWKQSGWEESSAAAFHFTGSEDSGSVHSFSTYLPWAGVCARRSVRVAKYGFIWLVFLNMFVHCGFLSVQIHHVCAQHHTFLSPAFSPLTNSAVIALQFFSADNALYCVRKVKVLLTKTSESSFPSSCVEARGAARACNSTAHEQFLTLRLLCIILLLHCHTVWRLIVMLVVECKTYWWCWLFDGLQYILTSSF